MGQVIWSPSALDDVDAIAEYIARDSVDRAALFVTRLFDAADCLSTFPDSGRVIPEIGDPSCREIPVATYRIMYRLEGGDVWITGVVHGVRNDEGRNPERPPRPPRKDGSRQREGPRRRSRRSPRAAGEVRSRAAALHQRDLKTPHGPRSLSAKPRGVKYILDLS